MMATITQCVQGIAKYLEAELIPRIDGWQKWVAGASISIALDNGQKIFDQYKDNEIFKALGVVDDSGDIDIDLLHDHIVAQAKKTPATFNLPFIGIVTLKASDVEKIYKSIKES